MSHEDGGQWVGQAAKVKVTSRYLLTNITKMVSVIRYATTTSEGGLRVPG